MADTKRDGRDELLLVLSQAVKYHEQDLNLLTQEIAGLKATLTADERALFEKKKEEKRHELAFAVDRQIRVLDEAIGRLRYT